MLLKIYGRLWAVLAILVAATFLTGNLSDLAIITYGLVTTSLIFMGMIGVLPITMAHPSHAIKAVEPARKQSREGVFGYARPYSVR